MLGRSVLGVLTLLAVLGWPAIGAEPPKRLYLGINKTLQPPRRPETTSVAVARPT